MKRAMDTKESRVGDKSTDHAWRHLQAIFDTTRLADAKAAALLAVAGVIEGIILGGDSGRAAMNMHAISLAATIGAAILVGLSAVSSISALVPRLKIRAADSLFYFGNITQRYSGMEQMEQFIADYRKVVKNEDQVIRHLSGQIWATGAVVSFKLRAVWRATWLLLCGVVLLGVSAGIEFLN